MIYLFKFFIIKVWRIREFMKRLILILSILLFGLNVNANELHTIILEGTYDGYNIILKSDEVPAVHKKIKNADNIVLDVKGVTPSASVNAIYRSSAEINSLVVENISDDELKIYINAKDIANATIFADTPNLPSVLLSDRFPVEKVLWSVVVMLIMAGLYKSAKALTEYENSILIKKDIKDREIELYRNFQRELSAMPKINAKIQDGYSTEVMPRLRRNYKELARR